MHVVSAVPVCLNGPVEDHISVISIRSIIKILNVSIFKAMIFEDYIKMSPTL